MENEINVMKKVFRLLQELFEKRMLIINYTDLYGNNEENIMVDLDDIVSFQINNRNDIRNKNDNGWYNKDRFAITVFSKKGCILKSGKIPYRYYDDFGERPVPITYFQYNGYEEAKVELDKILSWIKNPKPESYVYELKADFSKDQIELDIFYGK